MNEATSNAERGTIQVPTSGGWPLVAAFGFSLGFAGLLTHWMVSALGGICLVSGLVGWFREVLPEEAEAEVPLEPMPAPVAVAAAGVRHLEVGEQGHRGRFPLQRHPYSAGLRGGLVGGVAMAVLAILYGVVVQRSVWYPINLLAASGSASLSQMSDEQLRAFQPSGLVLALIIHGIGSALVGLLYGITLPMFPRRPVLLGGVMAPLFWTGLLHSSLGVINPALQARIDWFWFFAAQVAFGMVAGFVVARRERIATLQHVPFALRAGIEANLESRPGPPKGGPQP
ncbi:MAG: hypothetical protein J0L84_00865 [Verrucomicrobia bacterium]|nr:hypothetical protein [Verrucomicrobiota bacterium]